MMTIVCGAVIRFILLKDDEKEKKRIVVFDNEHHHRISKPRKIVPSRKRMRGLCVPVQFREFRY